MSSKSSIRVSSKRKHPRQACYVCGKHKEITQLHHVIPASEIAEKLEQGYDKYPSLTVWLCPNHHAYYHWMDNKSRSKPLAVVLSGEELAAFFELREMANKTLAEFAGIDWSEIDAIE